MLRLWSGCVLAGGICSGFGGSGRRIHRWIGGKEKTRVSGGLTLGVGLGRERRGMEEGLTMGRGERRGGCRRIELFVRLRWVCLGIGPSSCEIVSMMLFPTPPCM